MRTPRPHLLCAICAICGLSLSSALAVPGVVTGVLYRSVVTVDTNNNVVYPPGFWLPTSNLVSGATGTLAIAIQAEAAIRAAADATNAAALQAEADLRAAADATNAAAAAVAATNLAATVAATYLPKAWTNGPAEIDTGNTKTNVYGGMVVQLGPRLQQGNGVASGEYTFAGPNSSASGIGSWATYNSTASGNGSWAMRYGTASGNGSWAMYFGDASGIGSWAMYYSTASGLGSWAMSGGTATGDGSWATYGGTASGLGSWAMSGGTATGDGSWAMYGGTASGLGSWAMDNANATNDHSFAWRGGSHGAGTFNINPDGGVSGVWVGETNLAGIITGYGAAEAAIRAAADATNAAAVTAAAVAGTNYTDAAVNSEASIRAAADGTNAAQVAIALTNYQASADVNATGFVYAVSVAMTADVARAAAMTNALALAGHWRIIPYEYGGTPQASVGSIQLVNTNATSYANYPLPDRQDVGGATQATIRVIMGLNAASGQSNATAIATFDYVGQTDTTYPTIFSARDAVSRLHKTNTWTILLPAQSGSKLKIIRAAWPDTGASYIMGVSATFQSP